MLKLLSLGFLLGAFLGSGPLGLCAESLPPDGPRLPQDFQNLLKAEVEPHKIASPRGDAILLLQRSPSLPLSVLGRPSVGLAGEELDRVRLSPKRRSFYRGASLLDLRTGVERPLTLPQGLHVIQAVFSPDGRKLALILDGDKQVELGLLDLAKGKVQMLSRLSVNDRFISPIHWAENSSILYIAGTVGQAPEVPAQREDLTVDETKGQKVPARTFANLLKTPKDHALFEQLAQVQWYKITVEPKLKQEKWGEPGLYSDLNLAPDGKHALVKRFKKPFSNAVPAESFAQDVELWALSSDPKPRVLFEQSLADGVPPEGVRTGPRMIDWNPDAPLELIWWEALDGGDPRKAVKEREKLLSWSAPFEGAPQERLRTQDRVTGVSFFAEPMHWLVREYNPDTNMVRLSEWKAANEGSVLRKLLEYDSKDAYQNPGRLVHVVDDKAVARIKSDDGWVYLAGDGKSPKGERPFLDRMNLVTLQKERLYESPEAEAWVQDFHFFLAGDSQQWILSREDPHTPANYYLWDRRQAEPKPITHWVDKVPEMSAAVRKTLLYKRKDGVALAGELYLPANYKAGIRLPAVIWAYPDEYRNPEVAGQVRVSQKRYARPGITSINWLVTQGYAVLDNAAMPLIGSKETVNNTFIQQIQANAEAAVDALDAEGVADRKRIAVGGHSYGAFMTANLLAHTQLFCAGVARSGAYNRSLTPFGFQSERRTFWEAKDFYMDVSPFYHAEKIKSPLLLIHGKDDANPGTQTLQTERFFHALRGVGGRARMLLLPHEAHGYRGEENILRMHAETLSWLERHCRATE